jgi:uncharacterized protein (UPF0332 family)
MEDAIKQKVFQQAIDMFVVPEIERRKKIGKLSKKFILEKAQIIFSLNSGRNYVRLNDEVKAIIKCKINKSINKGDAVYEKDVDQIESVNLRDKDSNYGHITLLFLKGSWIVAFDFRYNKKISQEHIEASKEFCESSKENLKNKRLRPFFENAFASAELSAKSILLSIPSKEILKGKNHQNRISVFKNWADLGNVKIEFSTTLSKLNSLRDSARYLASNDFKKEDANKILSTIEEMIKFAEDSIK